MSTSSRNNDEISRVELPVFVSPVDLIFALNKRRSLVTIFNPYENEAQFKLLTTSPNRFDVNITKGIIKPRRCMDIAIRLPQESVDELPEAYEEPQVIDHFRVSLQVGNLRGSKAIRVLWCSDADIVDTQDATSTVGGSDERLARTRIRSQKQPTNTLGANQRTFTNQRISTSQNSPRLRATDRVQDGSNVNLDYELCKKVKAPTIELLNEGPQSMTLLSQLITLLSVSHEMKLGCSFALGLFTYRLISTLPE